MLWISLCFGINEPYPYCWNLHIYPKCCCCLNQITQDPESKSWCSDHSTAIHPQHPATCVTWMHEEHVWEQLHCGIITWICWLSSCRWHKNLLPDVAAAPAHINLGCLWKVTERTIIHQSTHLGVIWSILLNISAVCYGHEPGQVDQKISNSHVLHWKERYRPHICFSCPKATPAASLWGLLDPIPPLTSSTDHRKLLTALLSKRPVHLCLIYNSQLLETVNYNDLPENISWLEHKSSTAQSKAMLHLILAPRPPRTRR